VSLRAFALAAVLLAACGPKLHTGTGTVKEVRSDLRQLVLDHEDIEGLMQAMTMNFDVAAPELLAGLAPGDRVRFELSVDGEHYRIVAIERLGAGEADAVGKAGSRGLTAVAPEEDLAPAFALVDQDGRPLSLESLRGKVVLLDFVYTSCPGPCPIQTGMHVRVQQELPEPVRPQVWFASISLDPLRDTPEKLRAYAKARGADLASWSFLTGPRETVEEVLQSYGVGTVLEPNGEIQHVVVTFLIDAQGQIRKRYFGLDHDADEFLRDLTAAAQG
jgi:protein SCO1/2